MAEMLILLRRDPHTGRQNIIVKLDSDPDALPLEHEQLHRKLVESLVAGGAKLEDLGELVIERESESPPQIASDQAAESTGQAIREPG